jgi:hypothetical protein
MAKWITTTKKIVQDKFDCNYHFQDKVTLAIGPADKNEVATAKNIFNVTVPLRPSMLTSYLDFYCGQ